jgi:hypothetical protein
MQMIAGDESLQFRFIDSIAGQNTVDPGVAYDAKKKQLTIKASLLQHMTLDIKDLSSSHKSDEYLYWNMTAYTSAVLTDGDTRYYLYAKVSRNATAGKASTGVFELSASAKDMKSDAENYYLLMGILNSEYDGERSYASLYGYTEILPGRVTTDRVVSADGQSYFDMVNAAMKLAEALQFNVNGDGLLKLKGTIVQSTSGDENVIACFRGVYNSAYMYYKGDTVTYAVNGKYSLFRYISETPTKGNVPTNTIYWTVEASCGDYVSYVFKKSTTQPSAPTSTSPLPSGWSDAPDGTGRWWMSKATIDGATGKAGTWSTPVQTTAEDGTDGAYTDFKYAKNKSADTAPTISSTTRNPSGWSDTPPSLGEGEYLWMSQAEISADGTLNESWSTPVRISGEKGSTGSTGATGAAGNYTEYRYQKNGSTSTPPDLSTSARTPSGWDTSMPSVSIGYYLWMTKAEIKGSDDSLVGSWSTPVRVTPYDGADGKDGANGKDGKDGADGKSPAGFFAGVYDSTKTYYGTEYRLDVVKYNGVYKIARIDAGAFSGKVPTNTSYWNDFGSNFESVATQLLLAEWALIGSWVLRQGSIMSTDGLLSGSPSTDYKDGSFVPAVLLDSTNGQIKLGNNLILDKYSLGLFDSNGWSKVKVINASVGDFNANVSLKARPAATDTVNKTYSKYFSTTGTSFELGLDTELTKLGFMENGATITFESVEVIMTVPYVNTEDTLTISTTNPILGIIVYRNGVEYKKIQYADSNKTYTSGEKIDLTFTPTSSTKTINITKDNEGDYSFKVETENINAKASKTGNSKEATFTFKTKWSFTRKNYERTLIGYDGMLSCFGSGMIHFNSDGFIAKYGSYMLRVSSSGIQKSTNGGSSWTDL